MGRGELKNGAAIHVDPLKQKKVEKARQDSVGGFRPNAVCPSQTGP